MNGGSCSVRHAVSRWRNFRSVALERGQRLDQGAIHIEVFPGQQASPLGLTEDLGREAPCNISFQQAIAILGEGPSAPMIPQLTVLNRESC